MLWLGALTMSQAQIKPIRSGECYVNGTEETVFAVPKHSLERLLVKAQGFDTLSKIFPALIADTTILRVENKELRDALRSERREKVFGFILLSALAIAFLL